MRGRKTLTSKLTTARTELMKADDFVVALIDRLIKTERRLDEVQKQLDEQFTMIAEQQPRLTEDGLVTVRAMGAGDDAKETTVTLKPVTELPEQPQ